MASHPEVTDEAFLNAEKGEESSRSDSGRPCMQHANKRNEIRRSKAASLLSSDTVRKQAYSLLFPFFPSRSSLDRSFSCEPSISSTILFLDNNVVNLLSAELEALPAMTFELLAERGTRSVEKRGG
jgi:hypothetical protein